MVLSSAAVPLDLFQSSSYYVLPAYDADFRYQTRNLKFLQANSLPHQHHNSLNNSAHNSTSHLNSSIVRDQFDSTPLSISAFVFDEETTYTLENTVAIVVPILFGLIFGIGLIGNALVVIVVAFNASMRSTTNLLILNLAIADLLFILFCVPFTAVDYALSYWPFGMIWCKIVQYLICVLACASNYTLVLMSLDRYLAIVHPICSMTIRNAQNAYIAICLTWIFIIGACIPAIPNHTIVEYTNENDTLLSCTFNSTSNLTHTQFQLGFMVASYVIPLLIAFALYCLMLKKLWFSSSNVNSRLNNVRCRKRVTRMVIIVVLTFAICWAPIQIVLVLKTINMYNTGPTGIVLQIASQVLAYTNSCVNPILYAFLSENFRKAFHKVIACNLVGIYNTQFSLMQQTGQTSVAASHQSNYLASIRVNNQLKRTNTLTNKSTNDVNNNAKDMLSDLPNRPLRSVNFSIIADGGLFPKNSQQEYLSIISTNENVEMTKSGSSDTVTATLNNKKAQQALKGRFKATCLDSDEDVQADEFAMELHPMREDELNISYKTVPSVDDSVGQLNDSSTTNDTMNDKQTVTRMSSCGGTNGVFL